MTFAIKKEVFLEPAENFSSTDPGIQAQVRSCRQLMKLRRNFYEESNVLTVVRAITQSPTLERVHLHALRDGGGNSCLIAGPRLEEPGALPRET